MSFYDDASLIMFPSGYKEDKIYSLKPTDGSGDLTFTRASTATRVNADGLIETSPVNLMLYSETFNVGWGLQNGATIVANATTAPNGTLTADLLYPSVTNVIVAPNRTADPSSAPDTEIYTQYVYAKASGKNYLALYKFPGSGGTAAWFNLSTGVVGTVGSGCTAFIESAGNGWYKCGFSQSVTAGQPLYMHIYPTDGDNTITVTANGTDGIYIWGAQVNIGATAKPYFPTTDRLNVPRIDYTGGGCGKLLLEPQRTNLAFPSEDLTALTSGGMTNTANQATSPDGTQNADKSTIGSTTRFYDVITNPIIVTAIGTTYTTSFFAKKGTGIEAIYFYQSDGNRIAKFNLNNGAYIGHAPSDGYNAFTSYSSQSLGNGWYRLTATYTAVTIVGQFVIGVSTNTNNSVTAISGNGTDFVYVWGLQYEAGSYPTSYIPTLASSVTRLADVCNKYSISSLIGQTEGTLFAEVAFPNLGAGGGSSYIYITDGSFTNSVIIGREPQSPNSKLFFYINAGGTNILNNTANNLQSGVVKMAIGYKSGSWAAYLNGTLVASGTTTFTFSANMARFGIGTNDGSITITGDSMIASQAILFPTRLTNAQLATLTTL